MILPWNVHGRSLPRAVRRARRLGLSVVLWGHGYSKTPTWWGDRYRNHIGRKGDGVLLYNRTTAERLIRYNLSNMVQGFLDVLSLVDGKRRRVRTAD